MLTENSDNEQWQVQIFILASFSQFSQFMIFIALFWYSKQQDLDKPIWSVRLTHQPVLP